MNVYFVAADNKVEFPDSKLNAKPTSPFSFGTKSFDNVPSSHPFIGVSSTSPKHFMFLFHHFFNSFWNYILGEEIINCQQGGSEIWDDRVSNWGSLHRPNLWWLPFGQVRHWVEWYWRPGRGEEITEGKIVWYSIPFPCSALYTDFLCFSRRWLLTPFADLTFSQGSGQHPKVCCCMGLQGLEKHWLVFRMEFYPSFHCTFYSPLLYPNYYFSSVHCISVSV